MSLLALLIIGAFVVVSKPPLPSGAEQIERVTARVLRESPFTFQILPADWPSSIPSVRAADARIVTPDRIGGREAFRISQLRFNDIITAQLAWSYCPVDSELGQCTEVWDVRKAPKDIQDLFAAQNEQQSHIIIEYSGIGEHMSVYSDGKMLYWDSKEYTLRDTLPADTLQRLTEQCGKLSRRAMGKPETQSPVVTVYCQNYRVYSMADAVAKPFIEELGTLLEEIIASTPRILVYKKKHPVQDWQYGSLVSLGRANQTIHADLEPWSKMPLPADLLREAGDPTGAFDTFYREGANVYRIDFRTCRKGTEGTWACFTAKKLSNTWPTELSVRPRDIPPEGLPISSEEYYESLTFYEGLPIPSQEYQSHQAFYDGLRENLYVDGDTVFDNVRVTFRSRR